MKKSVFAFISALLMVAACQNEIDESTTCCTSYDVLSARIEQDEATKTALGKKSNVLWSENDQIVAFMKSSYRHQYQIKPSFVGKNYADFSLVSYVSGNNSSSIDHNVVYYPYSESVECMKVGEDYRLSVELPTIQIYEKNSFGNGTFPMVAVSDDNNITFRNICGGILLQLKGTQKVKSITIEGKNNEKLAGIAIVRAYTDDTKPIITMAENASTKVRLTCGDGIQLDESTPTEFIIALPPVEFTKGFKVTIEDESMNSGVIETDNANTVYRSSLLTMPEVNIVMNPAPNNQLWYMATEQITIPDDVFNTSVTSHEYNADTQKGIITFDGTLTSIGESAFRNCRTIFRINIPESVTSIGASAFNYCTSLASINIPKSVTSIGTYAFKNCNSMVSISIPESVTTIGSDAFMNCISLVEVRINGELTSYSNMFSGCKNLEKIYSPISTSDNRLMVHNGEVVAVACGGLTEFSIPEDVTSIGQCAFEHCSSLTNINIPESVTSIGDDAFYYCSSLSSINIPENVISIGNSTFSQCSSLTSINVPESVISIGNSAFSGCSSLTSIHMTEGLTSIGKSAFKKCSSLTDINIPESVVTIGNDAFLGCSVLTSIRIPKNVTSIEKNTFKNCVSLTTLYIEATTPPTVAPDAFTGAPIEIIYVPKESESAYICAEGWFDYIGVIKGYEY